ncbi:DUF874 domain-containing protein [Sesbania bispinosa]|nr:DUF874 domain-containing protein [Sesbania bispinosa]
MGRRGEEEEDSSRIHCSFFSGGLWSTYSSSLLILYFCLCLCLAGAMDKVVLKPKPNWLEEESCIELDLKAGLLEIASPKLNPSSIYDLLALSSVAYIDKAKTERKESLKDNTSVVGKGRFNLDENWRGRVFINLLYVDKIN